MVTQLRTHHPSNGYTPRRLRSAFIDWQTAGDWTHAITLNINRQVSIKTATKMFGQFCHRVDRYRFDRKSISGIHSAARFSAVAAIEHPDSNIHIHVAAKLSGWLPGPLSSVDERELRKMWGSCTKGSGSIEIKEAYDVRGWLSYMTKEFSNWPMNVIFSSDFHPT
jgi:hypothetical protein